METHRTSMIIKQSALLDTKTLRLEKEALNIRFAELGNSADQPVVLRHGVPKKLQCWYAVAPVWLSSIISWRSTGQDLVEVILNAN